MPPRFLSEPCITPQPRAVIKRVVEIEEIDGSEDGVETTIVKRVHAGSCRCQTKVIAAKLENMEAEDLDEVEKDIEKVDKEVAAGEIRNQAKRKGDNPSEYNCWQKRSSKCRKRHRP